MKLITARELYNISTSQNKVKWNVRNEASREIKEKTKHLQRNSQVSKFSLIANDSKFKISIRSFHPDYSDKISPDPDWWKGETKILIKSFGQLSHFIPHPSALLFHQVSRTAKNQPKVFAAERQRRARAQEILEALQATKLSTLPSNIFPKRVAAHRTHM